MDASIASASTERSPHDPEPPSAPGDVPQQWYLGIDIGTTGISAVLLNRTSCHLYPLYWLDTADAARQISSASRAEFDAGMDLDKEKRFRLPTTVSLTAQTASKSPKFMLRNFKPYLRIGIPHYSRQTTHWEPVLQWSDSLQVPLNWILQALQGLLATLTYPLSAPSGTTLTCGALGLEQQEFKTALHHLAGVILGYPSRWADPYRPNLRQAILGTKLVTQPEQVIFVEEAIAPLLSMLPSAEGHELVLPQQGQTPDAQSAKWQGYTLILNAGASETELAIVNLPDSLPDLTHADFQIRSLPYAGNAIDQDILCQLIYPALLEAIPEADQLPELSPEADLSLELVSLEELNLAALPLPAAGEPDLPRRYRLQQRLESSPSGQLLLKVARRVKFALQQKNQITLQFANQSWSVLRQDLASRVLLPYVQRLNRELNGLLTQTNTPASAVNQVLCTGGTGSLGSIARWLRQKFPHATIIQDTYPRITSAQKNCIPACSRVAYGLAAVPLHSQLVDLQQQYSDSFLLVELLQVFSDQSDHALSIDEILHRLEQRGINEGCRSRVLNLLEGQLPSGLVPSDPDALLLTPTSRQNPDYKAIQLAPLFIKQSNQTYLLNRYQSSNLRQYLNALIATQQKLTQPLPVSLNL